MKRAIRKYSRDFIAIILLVVLAAAVGGFVLSQQRFRFPFFSPVPMKMYADFSTAQAVTPGQGQSVRVSGVQVGTIDGVALKNGVAQVTMGIEPSFKTLIHTDATALLRPRTGLKDMFIELNPGTAKYPVAKAGWILPVANTLPDVNPDEFLSSLDTDTRDYIQLLVGGVGQGLYNNGHALQAVLEKFLPTAQGLRQVNELVAKRHRNLSRVIRSLNLLNTALAQRGPEVSSLVRSSAQVFNGFATEQANIKQAISDLPGTLRQSTTTLTKVQSFANVLGPAAQSLIPAAQALPAANRALIPFAQKTTPILANQIRPFVIASRPLVRSLEPASQNLATATPNLTSSFVVLNHLFNMLGYNQSGPNDSLSDPNRQEGYLYWLAWTAHDAASVFGNSDANGVLRSLTQEANCTTLNNQAGNISTALGLGQAQILGTLNVLLDPTLCGSSAPGGGLGLPAGVTLPSGVTIPGAGQVSIPQLLAAKGAAASTAPLTATPPTGSAPSTRVARRATAHRATAHAARRKGH